MTDPSQLRISDADRHRVTELLRDAAGEGRLDMDELDERIEATYSAKIYADLVPLVADIPGEAPTPGGLAVPGPSGMASAPRVPLHKPASGHVVPATPYESSYAVMSGVQRKGVWQVGPTHNAFAMMGGVEIDLREAQFTTHEVVINASAIMGGVDITVNAWTHVVVEGMGIMGGFEQSRDKVDPQYDASSPVVRVKGVALMGGVTVTRKPMPGERKKRKLLGG
ncbi:DUF1707 SHOCT-like domain-containing protein [Nocardioides alkalitolerans]|uniref:DUF1707 SHOCT-like domain-containing protein n=1 Tax=Nocardioides alkalitolerans TaxID=281714 RepID=UPI0003FCF34C|nr:DUF1707 domain-containing protein [Nocardioides alkalitolerans]